jgi:hypothetical protein
MSAFNKARSMRQHVFNAVGSVALLGVVMVTGPHVAEVPWALFTGAAIWNGVVAWECRRELDRLDAEVVDPEDTAPW